MSIDANSNYVGIGTSGPASIFNIAGTSVGNGNAQTNISAFVSNGMRINGTTTGSSQDAIAYQSGSSGGGAAIAFRRGVGYDTYMDFYTNNTSSGGAITQQMVLNNLGYLGIGTTGPDAKLDSLATSGEQLRLTYTDGTVYSGFTVNSGGDLNIDGTGNDITTPDRLTVGSSTAGVGKLNVTGAEVGKALTILNETGDQNILTASASGTTVANLDRSGNLSIEGAINDISGNLVLNDTVDLGSATTGVNVTTAGALSDTDANLVLNDTTDIGSATTGINIATTGLITDTDGNVVIGDTVDLGSATTGVNVTTAGAISDTDANLVLNDTVDIGSATTGIRVATTGSISDTDGNIALNDSTDVTGVLTASSYLQVGSATSTTYSRFGTGTTGHTLSGADALLVSGALEVD